MLILKGTYGVGHDFSCDFSFKVWTIVPTFFQRIHKKVTFKAHVKYPCTQPEFFASTVRPELSFRDCSNWDSCRVVHGTSDLVMTTSQGQLPEASEPFGVAVAAMRHALPVGQAELARRAGCSAAHLSNIEHGRSAPPGPSLALRLSRGLSLNGRETQLFIQRAQVALYQWKLERRQQRMGALHLQRGERMLPGNERALAADGSTLENSGLGGDVRLPAKPGSGGIAQSSQMAQVALCSWNEQRRELRVAVKFPHRGYADLVIVFDSTDLDVPAHAPPAITERGQPM